MKEFRKFRFSPKGHSRDIGFSVLLPSSAYVILGKLDMSVDLRPFSWFRRKFYRTYRKVQLVIGPFEMMWLK